MSIGGHQKAKGDTDEWLTPPEIINALGQFDLDPCSPIVRPWNTATEHYTINENGLLQRWEGRVWMNPPYSNVEEWMKHLAQHGNGTALIFARTETQHFFKNVWNKADSIFFFEGRLHFHRPDGTRAKDNGGAPSCLISYGENNAQAIEDARLRGKHIPINSVPMVIVQVSPSWKNVVSIAVTRLNKKGDIQSIYNAVEIIAPDKVRRNAFYKAKVRQMLQRHFTRISKGVYATKN